MKRFLLVLAVFSSISAFAQPFEIGHTTITFNDPARSGGFGSGGGPGRQIQSEIYYPADVTGTDVAFTSGDFPVIVFGHGFVMAWDAYANIWEELVPQGYILVFPRTEGGFSPSHDEFGLDLALLVTKMQEQDTTASSIFETHVSSKSAIMGHSMGGGASFLAAASNANIETVIGLAPAETTPSAVSAAALVTVPTLVFSGSGDAVTPPADHHLPIYNSVSSACKNFVSITGGAHCYFANSNFNCDFGEGSSGGSITVSRPEQHQILYDIVTPWLDYQLKGNCASNNAFYDLLDTDPRIVATKDCAIGSIDKTVTSDGVTLTSNNTTANYQWLDCDLNFAQLTGETNISLTPAPGNYAVELSENGCSDTSDCFTITMVGITELNPIDAKVYPNPSNGIVFIDVDAISTFQLIDLNGKTILEKELTKGENELDLSEINGIFIYRIESGNDKLVGRIILE